MATIASLGIKTLGRKLKDYVRTERHLIVEFLVHLKEFDDRRGYAVFNCRSLWEFCTSELGLLECATYYRVHAVKILKRHPHALEYLRDGRLTLTTLVALRKILDESNVDELLDRSSGKPRREVERIVAAYAPQPGPKTSLRALPIRSVGSHRSDASRAPDAGLPELRHPEGLPSDRACAESVPTDQSLEAKGTAMERLQLERSADRSPSEQSATSTAQSGKATTSLEEGDLPVGGATRAAAVGPGERTVRRESAVGEPALEPAPREPTLGSAAFAGPMLADPTLGRTAPEIQPALVLVAPAPARALGLKVRPVNEREFALHATVDEDFVDRLDEAKQIFSHSIPDGDLVEVLRRALQVAIEQKLKTKAGKSVKPRGSSVAAETVIPAAVRRVVWERDGGCCAWRHPDGHRCGSRWMVEFDHIEPQARGGASTTGNVRLLCREHNLQHARETYGEAFMERKRAKV